MKLIVGLGNPGKDYDGTRHNVGFECVDLLTKTLDLDWQEQKKCQAQIAKGAIEGVPVILAKPMTFMNASGQAVNALLSYYKIDPKNVLIIQDEMDLEPGRLAFLTKGGVAGHNGIADIQEKLGTTEVTRLRIGIGRPTVGSKEDWVLRKPEGSDKENIEKTIDSAAQAVKDWVQLGVTKAMNTWNQTSAKA